MSATRAQREYEAILRCLGRLGKPVRPDSLRGSERVSSECPVPIHDGKPRALSVQIKDDQVKIHCYAGCTPEQVKAALGPPKEEQGNGQPSGRQLKATKVSDIRMTATRWLWEEGEHGWIPIGALVGFGGREGVGKSTWCAHLAARVTIGALPGDFYGTPKGVIIVSTEDDWSATIKPRLVAAGADLDRVFHVAAVEPDGLEGTLSLPEDLQRLAEIIHHHDVALVILDPLLTLINKKLDTHKDAEVRQALGPMTKLAHDAKVSLIGLVHVNKSTEGDLLNRIMASRALTGVPRAFLFCARYTQSGGEAVDPVSAFLDGPRTEFVFGQIKNNLAAKVMISLRYSMETQIVGYDDEADKQVRASKLLIDDEPVAQNVEDIVLEQEKARKGVRTQSGKAQGWLVEFLDGKGEVPVKTVIKAGKEKGFSRDTLYRARRELMDLDRLVTSNLPTVPKTAVWKLLGEDEVENLTQIVDEIVQ